jgi:prepilin-type N-terminal cleavage/methylation domain-containing protein
MSNQRGFTLIEMILALVIIMIVGTMAFNAVGFATGTNKVSFGINGMTESRCIEGYKFIVNQNGGTRQILDEFGKGVRCDAVVRPGVQ